jgi:hypothetical protein
MDFAIYPRAEPAGGSFGRESTFPAPRTSSSPFTSTTLIKGALKFFRTSRLLLGGAFLWRPNTKTSGPTPHCSTVERAV